jgi:hypothetical protein
LFSQAISSFRKPVGPQDAQNANPRRSIEMHSIDPFGNPGVFFLDGAARHNGFLPASHTHAIATGGILQATPEPHHMQTVIEESFNLSPSQIGMNACHRLGEAPSELQLESGVNIPPSCDDSGVWPACVDDDHDGFADPFHDDWAHW